MLDTPELLAARSKDPNERIEELRSPTLLPSCPLVHYLQPSARPPTQNISSINIMEP
jgi:3-methyladenine DNA glycosylase AlkC